MNVKRPFPLQEQSWYRTTLLKIYRSIQAGLRLNRKQLKTSLSKNGKWFVEKNQFDRDIQWRIQGFPDEWCQPQTGVNLFFDHQNTENWTGGTYNFVTARVMAALPSTTKGLFTLVESEGECKASSSLFNLNGWLDFVAIHQEKLAGRANGQSTFTTCSTGKLWLSAVADPGPTPVRGLKPFVLQNFWRKLNENERILTKEDGHVPSVPLVPPMPCVLL